MRTAALTSVALLFALSAQAGSWGIEYSKPSTYLRHGKQSEITDSVFKKQIADKLKPSGEPTLESVRNAYQWIRKYIRGQPAGGKTIGKRTSDAIYQSGITHGCHDDGLLFSSVMREIGVSAVMVDTNGINWIESQRSPSKPSGFEGHVFVEIFIQGKWMLVDSTTGQFIKDYDTENPWIPIGHDQQTKGYWVMEKGLDLWDYGIKSLADLKKLQLDHARKTDPSKSKPPLYRVERL